jgi:hypothetical protein
MRWSPSSISSIARLTSLPTAWTSAVPPVDAWIPAFLPAPPTERARATAAALTAAFRVRSPEVFSAPIATIVFALRAASKTLAHTAGANSLQFPSETTSTAPSTTWIAVASSIAYAGLVMPAAQPSAAAIELSGRSG